MSGATFQIDVSLSGPREVMASLGGAAASLYRRETTLTTTSSDWLGGFANVTQMKVWGSIDPSFDLRMGASEGASEWITYSPMIPLVVSAGIGVKTVSVRLKNRQGQTSTVATDTSTLLDIASVAILWVSPRRHVGVTSFTEIGWSSSHAFASYRVLSVTNLSADSSTGTQISGAPNEFASGGAGTAGTLFITRVATPLDFDLASTTKLQSGRKFLKVWCTSASSVYGTFS